MKKLILISLSIVSLCQLRAMPIIAPAIGGVVGYLATKGQSSTTQAAAIAGGSLIMGIGQSMFENKQAKRDFHNYQLGMWQEAWIRDQLDWYNSTLDHRSGLPPSYDGHWAMYNGLPEQEAPFVQQREQMPDQFVPSDREAYINYLVERTRRSSSANASASQTVEIPTTTTVEPARSQNGVKYRPRVREFPRLP